MLFFTDVRADTALLPAIKDNTLYQTYSGSATNSNGKGEHIFAGRTDEGYLRRGLVAFDLSAIPPGSTVTGVTVTLVMSRSKASAVNVSLHRATANWGEGTSNATQEEGRGAQATAGDATWLHRFYPTSFWATAGGDFVPTTSAVTSVSREGSYTWSGAGLVSDVQAWLNNPGTNFGWLIRGGEVASKTATRFDSHEVAMVANRPVLRVGYVPPQPVGACCLPDDSCLLLTSNQCAQAGGTFAGVGTTCTPNPCQPPVGACCLTSGVCEELTQIECTARGGTYHGDGSTCTVDLCPVVLTPFVDALPVPGPLSPVSGSIGGPATYDIPMRQVQQKLHRDLPLTTVWAYGNASPGPLIEATAGQPVTVIWRNDLRDSSGNLRTNHYLAVDRCLHGPDTEGDAPRTVVHLHGGKVSQRDDGYPEDTFLPGQSRTNYYGNDQPPGTVWFHDHALGITRLNVYMGLAGLYLLRDAFENALGLPSGQNELPLVIQDRKFNPNGSLKYPAEWEEHFFGDTVMVNGKVWPYVIVRRGKYRFRLLNGSTSRTYTLGLSSGATFHQIGTDFSLLPAPVPTTQVTIMPGERADVVMDFAGAAPNSHILLTNGASAPFPSDPAENVITNVLKFVVTNIAGHTAPLPVTLRPMDRLYESNAVQHRNLVLRKGTDPCTGSLWLINDMHWDHITEFPVLGTTEVWSFINRSGVAHPMHLHLVLMQILDRQPFVYTNGMDVPTGPRVPPAAHENGWKDTVPVGSFEIVRVIARFDGFTGKYPYHCHILEHEDHEMMRQFEVVLPPRFTTIQRAGLDILLSFQPSANRRHFLQRRNDFAAGAWTTFATNILGGNTNLSVLDPIGATQKHRVYRIGVNPQ